MKIVGIISEYNPFHNGHKYHIEKAKQLTNSSFAVAVMSGNYVQRGEPSIFDKYTRTKVALLNGADMVLELPVFTSTASAEFFAMGAIDIMNKSKIIDYLCFGSEHGNIDILKDIALFLTHPPEAYSKLLKDYLGRGLSYPVSRSKALIQFGFDGAVLKAPNNILAIEYLKALIKSNSNITPLTIIRKGSGYHDKNLACNNGFSSASAIRESIWSNNQDAIKNSVPPNCINLFKNPHNLDKMSEIFHYIIATKDVDWLRKIADVDEGIENRILKSVSKHFYLSNIISEIKSKRYTFTKIQRTLLHILLEITKADCLNCSINGTGYIRVLGFRRDSESLLSYLHNMSQVPVITNLKNADRLLDDVSLGFLMKEVQTSDIYYLTNKIAVPKNHEFYLPMVIC